jgi:hypothetical protein
MTTAQLARRVDRIEARSQPARPGPGYVCFASEAELRAYRAQPGAPRLTAYVQVSPDDWDTEP